MVVASAEELFLRCARPGGPDECWLWEGSTNGSYGIIQVASPRHNILVHRFSYKRRHKKKNIDGKVVRHTCDTPLCYNPKHLVLGTQFENIRECVEKGRHTSNGPKIKGEGNDRCKLTERQVRTIFRSKKTRKELAAKYCVAEVTIYAIKEGRIWKHLNLLGVNA